MRDNNTGRSRGFGFLTFKDPKTVNVVMVKEHFLDGKIVSPRACACAAHAPPCPIETVANSPRRSTPSAPSRATSKKRRARSSSAASARRPRTRSSASTSSSSAASSTPPS